MKRCSLNKKEDEYLIQNKYDLYKDWVQNEFDMMGSEIRIAKLEEKGKENITAYSLIDVFDKKVDSKVIRFFHQVKRMKI